MVAIFDRKTFELLTEPEAARTLRISPRSLFGLRKNGDIPCVRIGVRGVRYDLRDLEAFVHTRRKGQIESVSLN